MCCLVGPLWARAASCTPWTKALGSEEPLTCSMSQGPLRETQSPDLVVVDQTGWPHLTPRFILDQKTNGVGRSNQVLGDQFADWDISETLNWGLFPQVSLKVLSYHTRLLLYP